MSKAKGKPNPKIEGTGEAWDMGLLGNDPAHTRVVDKKKETEIDEDLGLQMISIRLPKQLIDVYKAIAPMHGFAGYQPLMREALIRFAQGELKQIARHLRPGEPTVETSEPEGDCSPDPEREAA